MDFTSTEIRQWLFDSAQSSPGVWLIQALRLRGAAKRIEWIGAAPGEMYVKAFPTEYRLLIALSTENLVKGILIAERMRRLESDPFGDIMHHRLADLAKEIKGLPISLSCEEVAVLEALTEYVEWAGRYPFPKRLDKHRVISHSNAEHDREIALCERLAAYLRCIGWVSKGHPDYEGWHWLLTK